jgi:hypothetical protein
MTTELWHGTTTGYGHYGCRCTPCRNANTTYKTEWRQLNTKPKQTTTLRVEAPPTVPPPTSRDAACIGYAWLFDAAMKAASLDNSWARHRTNVHADVQAALDVCAGCPLRGPCLEYALAAGDDHSILGGTTPMDRKRMTRRRRP